ncbi:MAG: caspase family protein [Acidobacteria bacterium]|nr:caspase family protein [Acidobacteriota bacterium]
MSSYCVFSILSKVLLASLCLLSGQAQPAPRRIALLIGNSEYSGRALSAVAADATLMRAMLLDFEFDAGLIQNAGFAEMRGAVGAFVGRLGSLGSRDAGLLYYAGFCAQTPTDTYLIPVDFGGRTDADLQARAISVRELQARFASQHSGLKVLALSGCRDYNETSWNPVAGQRAGNRGVALAPVRGDIAVILAMEPALAGAQDGARPYGGFMIAMREALGRRDTDLLGALLSAASRFGSSVSNPQRAQIAWQLDGPANDFRIERVAPRAAARPPARSTVRDFLVRVRKEDSGYGLYSYLLFPSRPAPTEEARYQEVIGVYLSMLETAGTSSFARRELNITYIPVTGLVGPPATPEKVLAAYDYEGALKIIQAQRPDLDTRKGPYVISSLVPLTGATGRMKSVIFQDLSAVPQDLIPLYIREFEALVAQERSWASETMDGFLLSLRTAIGRVASEGRNAAPAFSFVIELWK